jgi:polyhydroxyalkanoate synthesis regulator phasin
MQEENSEIVRLREEIAVLQGQVRRLELRTADLEAALRMPKSVAEPSITEADYHHFTLAERYHYIVDQLLVGVVDKWSARRFSDDRDRHAAEAMMISGLTAMLFGKSAIDYERLAAAFADPEVPAADIQNICDRVTALRDRVAKTGSQSWDFAFRKGRRLDPKRQAAWPGCADDGLTCFVVAPSYVALNNKVFSRQLVFTRKTPVRNSWFRRLFRLG